MMYQFRLNQMVNKIIYIENVGEVLFRRSKRAKHLSISVKPFYGVRVSVPSGLSFSNAVLFVQGKKSWIRNHLEKIKIQESLKPIIDEKSKFIPNHYSLHLQTTEQKKISAQIFERKIIVSHPDNLPADSREVQSAIKKGIVEALRIEAKSFFPARVRLLADRFGLKFNKLCIKNLSSRWGSCSGKNNINLNLHLMNLPEYLIDYVILHELAHTVHHNHSKNFWDLLNDLTGDAKGLDKKLKKFNLTLF